MGKNSLLVTPEASPRVHWAIALTDTPLIVTEEPIEVMYGECNECVELCPVLAFTGEPFREKKGKKQDMMPKKMLRTSL